MAGGSFLDSDLTAVNQMVKALWMQNFNTAQDNLPYQLLTTDLGQSKAKVRALDWLGEVPQMATMGGTIQTGGIRRYDHTLTHEEYGMRLKVRISDLATDQLNQLPSRIAGLARKAASHPGQLAFAQIESNPTGYDGAAYFANTHTFGSAANADNLAGGTGVTSAAIETDIATIRSTMMRFQDDTGQAMEIAPDTFVIPPELSLAFAKVLGVVREAGSFDNTVGVTPPGQGNVWKAGGYTVIERTLSDVNNWYAFHTAGEVKPFLYSWVTAPRVMNTPSFNDATATNHAYLEYVVYGEYAVGVSLPQYGICVVN